jgi:hypothetical protein
MASGDALAGLVTTFRAGAVGGLLGENGRRDLAVGRHVTHCVDMRPARVRQGACECKRCNQRKRLVCGVYRGSGLCCGGSMRARWGVAGDVMDGSSACRQESGTVFAFGHIRQEQSFVSGLLRRYRMRHDDFRDEARIMSFPRTRTRDQGRTQAQTDGGADGDRQK